MADVDYGKGKGKPDPGRQGRAPSQPGEASTAVPGSAEPNAGVEAGNDPNRYNPQVATGADPGLPEGRNSGEPANQSETAGTTAEPNPNTDRPGAYPGSPVSAHVGEPNPASGNRPGSPEQYTAASSFTRTDAGDRPTIGGGRRPMKPDSQYPAGMLFVDPKSAEGDITIGEVSDHIRGIIAAVKGGDFLDAGERIADFLKLGISIFREQFRQRAEFADDAAFQRHGEQWRDFEKAAKEWDATKDATAAVLPTMHNRDGHQFGAASGALAPMGKPADAAGRSVGTWVTMMELVSRIIEELRKLNK